MLISFKMIQTVSTAVVAETREMSALYTDLVCMLMRIMDRLWEMWITWRPRMMPLIRPTRF